MKTLIIVLMLTLLSCTETIFDTESIEQLEVVTDSLTTVVDSLKAIVDSLESVTPDTFFIHDTTITSAQISMSLYAVAFWSDNNLLASLFGRGINLSDNIIDSVSIEFTLTANSSRDNILSESVGYFLTESPPFEYVPNDPFPYEIQHNLEPDSVNYIYVGADTLEGIDSAFWYFRLIVADGLNKQVSNWHYGGELIR